MTTGTAEARDSRIIIAGEAGQGIRFAGVLLAKAAAVTYRHVSEAALFGAAVRTGMVTSHVQLSETFISYPIVETPDCLLISSASAAERYAALPERPAVIIHDSSLVSPPDAGAIGVPATEWLTREFGDDRGAALMLLGALAATTRLVTLDRLMETAAASGAPSREINTIALAQGARLPSHGGGHRGGRRLVTLDLEKCERSAPKHDDRICRICELTCPDLAISSCVRTGAIQIDSGRCKTCGLCAHLCPRDAILLT